MRTSELLLAGSLVAVLGLSGCNQRSTDDTLTDPTPEPAAVTAPAMSQPSTPATPTPAPGMVTVDTAGAAGPYLANAAGNALYLLEGNTDGSKCVGACLQAWPPVLATEGMPGAGAKLDSTLLSTIKRADGPLQVAYNRHPLHRYAADTGAGRPAGHGVQDQWGHWYLVNPQGDPLEHKPGD